MAQSSSVPTRGPGNRIIKCAVSKCINNSFGLNALLKEQFILQKRESFVAALIRFRCSSFPVVPEVGGRKKQTLFWTFGWKF